MIPVVSVEAFAKAAGYSPATVRHDLTSSDPARRMRWPEFRKAGGKWITTTDEVRRWWDRLTRSSYLDKEASNALGWLDPCVESGRPAPRKEGRGSRPGASSNANKAGGGRSRFR